MQLIVSRSVRYSKENPYCKIQNGSLAKTFPTQTPPAGRRDPRVKETSLPPSFFQPPTFSPEIAWDAGATSVRRLNMGSACDRGEHTLRLSLEQATCYACRLSQGSLRTLVQLLFAN